MWEAGGSIIVENFVNTRYRLKKEVVLPPAVAWCCVAWFACGPAREGCASLNRAFPKARPAAREPSNGHPQALLGWADRVVFWCVHQGSASSLGTQPMW